MRKQEDYYNYPYNGIKERKRMSLEDRAAQFNPFAALTGYEGVIADAGFVGDERIELSESQKAEINDVLVSLKKGDEVRVMYYEDEQYQDHEGAYEKYDQIKKLLLVDKKKIRLDEVIWLEKK